MRSQTEDQYSKRWIVAITQPKREQWAAENVIRQGYEVYHPRFVTSQDIEGRKKLKMWKTQSLFPGYLFVHTPGIWRFLIGTFGVMGVVMLASDTPAVLPDQVMVDLRARQGLDGAITLPKRFAHGQSVRVTGGAFQGLSGIWDGSTRQERECVLLDVLGGKTRVLVAKEFLEAV